MESLFSNAQGAVDAIVPMIVLLGLLIFVHELGHFLVAKYFGVRVEVFSLGFGPKLFKFKRGDTTYAISAIPLGGYVKMFGDDPTANVESDQKKFSFTHKPVGQRIAVVLAGPLMNFFFAILIFAVVAMIGEQALAPKLGDIETKSAAFAQGFRDGDTVKAVNSEDVKTWDDFQKAIEKNANQEVQITVARAGSDATEVIKATPKLEQNKNVLSWDRHVGAIEGLTPQARSTFIGVPDPKSPAGKAGLRSGDQIKSINGVVVTKWKELEIEVAKAAAAKAPLSIEVERGFLADIENPKTEVVKAEIASVDGENPLQKMGIEFPELFLAALEKDAPAAKAGLQVGDRLISIDGKPVESFDQVATIIRSFGDRQPVAGENSQGTTGSIEPLKMSVLRDGEPKEFALVPNMKTRMSNQGKEERRFEIGIRPMIIDATPTTVELAWSNPIAAVQRGFEQTVRWTSLTVLSFVRLFQAEVSPKNIGGFLSIGQMAKRSWQIGASQFLNVMAIISINLFILNLLPVPVLDGGHLVFYTIEAVKGAPLSMRKMEIAQQVGLVLLLGLMVFALFNDFSRLVFN